MVNSYLEGLPIGLRLWVKVKEWLNWKSVAEERWDRVLPEILTSDKNCSIESVDKLHRPSSTNIDSPLEQQTIFATILEQMKQVHVIRTNLLFQMIKIVGIGRTGEQSPIYASYFLPLIDNVLEVRWVSFKDQISSSLNRTNPRKKLCVIFECILQSYVSSLCLFSSLSFVVDSSILSLIIAPMFCCRIVVRGKDFILWKMLNEFLKRCQSTHVSLRLRSNCGVSAIALWPIIAKNCDAVTHNYEKKNRSYA